MVVKRILFREGRIEKGILRPKRDKLLYNYKLHKFFTQHIADWEKIGMLLKFEEEYLYKSLRSSRCR